MKIETYLKAKRLYKDMDRLRALIRDTENGKGGIRVTTYLYTYFITGGLHIWVNLSFVRPRLVSSSI